MPMRVHACVCSCASASVVDQAALPEVIFAEATKPAAAAGAGAGAGESKASGSGVEYGSPTKRLQSVAELEAARARVQAHARSRDDDTSISDGEGGEAQPGAARLRDVALVIAADGVEAQPTSVAAGRAEVESPTLVRGCCSLGNASSPP